MTLFLVSDYSFIFEHRENSRLLPLRSIRVYTCVHIYIFLYVYVYGACVYINIQSPLYDPLSQTTMTTSEADIEAICKEIQEKYSSCDVRLTISLWRMSSTN